MYELVYSILAHEAPDVLINQIENIKKWNVNKNFLICLHLNDYMYNTFKTDDPHVIINSEHFNKRIYTIDLLHAHLKNVIFLREKGIHYKTLMLLASNVMFIQKFNIDENQPTIEMSSSMFEVEKPYLKALQKNKNVWIGWRQLSAYPQLIDFFTRYKIPLVAEQNEGRLYPRKLIEKIADFVFEHKLISYAPGILVAEEIFLPSLEMYFCNSSMVKYHCKVFWDSPNYTPSIQDINTMKNDPENKYTCIKRVHRILNDPIRKYINRLEL
jgi:hypothetical protein